MPLYAGAVPRRYRMDQRVGKWSPQLIRTFSIGGEVEADVPALNWDEVGPSVFRSKSGLNQLKSILVGDDFPGSIHLFHHVRVLRVSGKVPAVWRPILRPACVRKSKGMFALVSRISPNGGGSFEDLAIADPTESREWLLVVTVPRGDDLIVLRRLYRRGRR